MTPLEKYFPPSSAELDLRYHFSDWIRSLVSDAKWQESGYSFSVGNSLPLSALGVMETYKRTGFISCSDQDEWVVKYSSLTFDEFVLQRGKPIDWLPNPAAVHKLFQRYGDQEEKFVVGDGLIDVGIDFRPSKDKDYSLGLCKKLYREGETPRKTTWLDGYATNDKLAAINAKLHRE